MKSSIATALLIVGAVLFWGCVGGSTLAQVEDDKPADKNEERRKIDFETTLTREQAHRDIEQFRTILGEKWILVKANDADFDVVLDELKIKANDGMTVEQLTLGIQKTLAMGIDGHATVGPIFWCGNELRNGVRSHAKGQMPFFIDLAGDKFVAYIRQKPIKEIIDPKNKFRFALLDDEYPFLVEIDELPIEKWIDCARQFVPQGPDRAVRWRCATALNGLRFFRDQLGLELKDTVRVKLMSDDLQRSKVVELLTSDDSRLYRRKPRHVHRLLDGNIGYISMRNCAETGFIALAKGMSRFKDTDGLVIDLRDNLGHGSPDTTVYLGACLLPDDVPQKVVGTVIKRKDLAIGISCVAPGMSGLTDGDESAIREFAVKYQPEFSLPGEGYDWTYVMVHNPKISKTKYGLIYGNPPNRKKFASMVHPYRKPVVMLTSHRTFSAGELFASCMQSFPGVTIVGTPTAASAVSPEEYTLTQSGLTFLCGKRVFQSKDGKLVDGRGVQPDVLVEIDADYYRDTRDTTLEAAVEVIEKENAK